MTPFEFIAKKSTPDASVRGCEDCLFLRGAVSLWCTNRNAIARRRTAIPGTFDCPQWKPLRTWESLGPVEKIATRLNPFKIIVQL